MPRIPSPSTCSLRLSEMAPFTTLSPRDFWKDDYNIVTNLRIIDMMLQRGNWQHSRRSCGLVLRLNLALNVYGPGFAWTAKGVTYATAHGCFSGKRWHEDVAGGYFSMSAIKEMLRMWKRLSEFIQRTTKCYNWRATALFSNTCLTHFKRNLKNRWNGFYRVEFSWNHWRRT